MNLNNVVYAAVSSITDARENNGSYKGNSHHLAQEITAAVCNAISTSKEPEGKMTRMFKAHIKPGTKLQGLSRAMKESLKYDIEKHSCDGWKNQGLVLKRDHEFCQKVKITLIIEKVNA